MDICAYYLNQQKFKFSHAGSADVDRFKLNFQHYELPGFLTTVNRVFHIFTARVAKRAKVMFSQACVTHSVQLRGGGRWATRSQHLPPLGPGHNTSLPPRTRSQHLPPPRTRSQHLPPPRDYAQVRILLECILLVLDLSRFEFSQNTQSCRCCHFCIVP